MFLVISHLKQTVQTLNHYYVALYVFDELWLQYLP
jgi:hypothetical protein